MENLKKLDREQLESLAKRYNEESPEEKKKRRKWTLFPAVINSIAAIAMLAVGIYHHTEERCKTGEATLFLIIGGTFLLVGSGLKVLAYLTPCKCDDKLADVTGPLCDLVYFIVVIWGSVQVFGKFDDVIAQIH